MSTTSIRTFVTDPLLRAYIQQYPFLTGPDENANRRALMAIRGGIRVSKSTHEASVRRPASESLALTPPENQRAGALLRSIGLSDAQARSAEHDFAWRVSPVPSATQSILCLGSGEGDELVFLRAKAPHARIVVLDYVQKLRPGLLTAVSAEFIQCDMVSELASHPHQFDLVFSNHTLEHMFDPDQILALIHKRLRQGGMIVSGLPLDGDASVPLQQSIADICAAASRLHAIDLGVFDAGHPWKTNAADLTKTLFAAGFSNIDILQRDESPYRSAPHRDKRAATPRVLLGTAYAMIFKTARSALKLLYPEHVPHRIRRLLVALERRVPFGANRLKNTYAPDVTFSAVK